MNCPYHPDTCENGYFKDGESKECLYILDRDTETQKETYKKFCGAKDHAICMIFKRKASKDAGTYEEFVQALTHGCGQFGGTHIFDVPWDGVH